MIQSVSIDCGSHMTKMTRPFGITIDRETIIFDSWKHAYAFSQAISDMVERYEADKVESHVTNKSGRARKPKQARTSLKKRRDVKRI